MNWKIIIEILKDSKWSKTRKKFYNTFIHVIRSFYLCVLNMLLNDRKDNFVIIFEKYFNVCISINIIRSSVVKQFL